MPVDRDRPCPGCGRTGLRWTTIHPPGMRPIRVPFRHHLLAPDGETVTKTVCSHGQSTYGADRRPNPRRA